MLLPKIAALGLVASPFAMTHGRPGASSILATHDRPAAARGHVSTNDTSLEPPGAISHASTALLQPGAAESDAHPKKKKHPLYDALPPFLDPGLKSHYRKLGEEIEEAGGMAKWRAAREREISEGGTEALQLVWRKMLSAAKLIVGLHGPQKLGEDALWCNTTSPIAELDCTRLDLDKHEQADCLWFSIVEKGARRKGRQ